jgi:hypothetical protein
MRITELSKSNLSCLIQIVTGHNFLSYFQYQLDNGMNPMRRICDEENETFYHFVTDCPAFGLKRWDMVLDNQPVTNPWTPIALTDFSYMEPIDTWFTVLELEVDYSVMDSDDLL